MKEYTISVPLKEYQLDELPSDDRELVEAAKAMTANSLAPYSKFHVGAAIRMADGRIVRGANQENVAFPSGTCAERTACFQAGALYPAVAFKKIAIAAWTREGHSPEESWEDCFQEEPISPCGACRQALLEYETIHGPVEVILYGRKRTLVLPSVASLLPLCFTKF